MWFQCFFSVLVTSVAAREAYGSVGYFWHITDIHFDAFLNQKGCWKPEYEGHSGSRLQRRYSGLYGDYGCDSPWKLVESAINAMKTRQDVDFLLWTGDTMSRDAKIKLMETRQLSLIQNITDLLLTKFSTHFVFPALGHDDLHSRKELSRIWSRWLPAESTGTFEKGGYYLIARKEQVLQIVVLNTILWTNDHNDNKAEAQFKWLESVLDSIESSRKLVKACLVGHVPPGSTERVYGGTYTESLSFTEKYNKRYIDLVVKHANIIVGQFFGHLHTDAFRVMYDKGGNPVQWAMIAPGVSPKTMNNPGLRLYKFDKITGKILDYTQYYLDLSNANSITNEEPEWKVEYNFSSYFRVADITPHSLHSIAEKLVQSPTIPNNIFSRYYRANFVGNNPPLEACDASCVHMFYCAITKVDHIEYDSCVKAPTSAFSASTASLLSDRLMFFKCFVCCCLAYCFLTWFPL